MGTSLRLKFWGTRGLISAPGADTVIHGGNTTCLQIFYKNTLLLIDTGFGVTNLGELLMRKILQRQQKITAHIFYTHFHWDHIQGLPFFHPIYFPTSHLHFYTPGTPKQSQEALDVLFDGSYSPFAGLSSMPAHLHFHELNGSICIDDLTISYTPLDHGWHHAPAYAYKFTTPAGDSLVLALDHEARDSQINRDFINFAKGCKLLVHDAQFGADSDYATHVGWGHSSLRQALENGLACGAEQLLLTHHHPDAKDATLLALQAQWEKNPLYKNLKFSFAKEANLYKVTENRRLKK